MAKLPDLTVREFCFLTAGFDFRNTQPMRGVDSRSRIGTEATNARLVATP